MKENDGAGAERGGGGRRVIVVAYLLQQANKTCNNNIISLTKLGNQKVKRHPCAVRSHEK